MRDESHSSHEDNRRTERRGRFDLGGIEKKESFSISVVVANENQKQPWSPTTTLQEADNVAIQQYGDRLKVNPCGLSCPRCHHSPQWPVHPEMPQVQQSRHFARDCRSTGNTNVANTQKGNGAAPKGKVVLSVDPRHFTRVKRDCPKLRNKDGGNRNAQGWVYAVGNA
ncbi:hypothetical protein Tco_1374820 [Tanacetum coccineum]